MKEPSTELLLGALPRDAIKVSDSNIRTCRNAMSANRFVKKLAPREQLINAYGYQGIKGELERERMDFAIVMELSQQLNNLVGANF